MDTGYGTFLIKENHTGRSLWAFWGQGEFPRTDQHAQKSKAIQMLPSSFFVGSPPGGHLRLLGVASEEEDAVAAHHGLKMGYSGASARIHDSDPTSLCQHLHPKAYVKCTVGINPHKPPVESHG